MKSWRRVTVAGLAVVALCLCHSACSSDKPALIDPGALDRGDGAPTTHNIPHHHMPDASMEPPDHHEGGVIAVSEGGPPLDSGENCFGKLSCHGHSHCAQENGRAECVCDDGYVAGTDGGQAGCVVDETCIKLHYLEDYGCRVQTRGAPAVGLFFAVDYCAGTAVLPDKLGDVTTAFKVLEDGKSLSDESFATVIPRSVESYVTIAMDLSGSVQSDTTGLLGDLITRLRAMVQQLKRPPTEPPVGVSVMAFGRFVEQIIPFTTNVDDVDAALAAIQANPSSVGNLAGQNGTSLHEAVEKGIHQVERIQKLRDSVSDAGVLTSGTFVVITDGDDLSGRPLNTDLVKNTLVNLISVGISSDINGSDLTTIGRDGAFLAPDRTDWSASFDEVAERVANYPKRAYLLGYCSPATNGQHSVSVTLNGQMPKEVAQCTFDADVFGSNPDDVCNADFFANACPAGSCGGLVACGACPDSECCSARRCASPGHVVNPDGGMGPDCRGQNELCAASGLVCALIPGTNNPQRFQCQPAIAQGTSCANAGTDCAPGLDYCAPVPSSPPLCQPVTFVAGQQCGDATNHPGGACPTQNCAQTKPENAGDTYLCQPPAVAFDLCAGPHADATCESGTACQPAPAENGVVGSVCTPRHSIGCMSDLDCASGACEFNVCQYTGACYFSWDQKMDH